MISHWDDVPWKSLEHGELHYERQRLRPARGRGGATLSRYPDSRKICFRGLGVIARVEPLGYWDGEEE